MAFWLAKACFFVFLLPAQVALASEEPLPSKIGCVREQLVGVWNESQDMVREMYSTRAKSSKEWLELFKQRNPPEKRFSPGLALSRLREVSSTPLEKYFPDWRSWDPPVDRDALPEPVDPNGLDTLVRQAKIYTTPATEAAPQVDAEKFAEFRREFYRVLSLYRKKTDGVIGQNKFREWAWGEIERYRSRPEMKRLIGQGFDWKTLIELELKNKYLYWNAPKARLVWLQERFSGIVTRPLVALPLMAATGLGGWVITQGKQAAWFATIPTGFGAFINPYLNVIIQLLQQLGIQVNGPGAAKLNMLVTDMMTSLNEVQSDIADARADLQEMDFKSEEDVEKNLAKMGSKLDPVRKMIEQDEHKAEKYAAMLAAGINANFKAAGYLRGDEGTGRNVMWSTQIFTPIDLDRTKAIFEGVYLDHKQLYLRAKDRIEDLESSGRLTPEKRAELEKEIEIHSKGMRSSMQRIAGAVAMWKFNEFAFPEFTKKWVDEETRNYFAKIYQEMKTNQGFYDDFLAEVGPASDKILNRIHSIIRDRVVFIKTAKDVIEESQAADAAASGSPEKTKSD